MAAALPAKLKTAGLTPFATRATQLEKFKPILHSGDEETQTYAVQLMDTLEAFKVANTANDAITDDLAAKAYIENFAAETFARGDEAQRTNRVTRQTADTFQAASTFIELLSIWGTMEDEWVKRSKYAKYHAVRIAKAIKAGEDPNATNPVVEEPEALVSDPDDVDAELKALERGHNDSLSPATSYRAPTVEDAPPSALSSRPQSVRPSDNIRTPTSRTMSATSQSSGGNLNLPSAPQPLPHNNHHSQMDVDVSPIDQPRQGSIGGGYFPTSTAISGDSQMTDDDPPIVLPHPTTSQRDNGSPESDYYSSHTTSTPTPGAGPPPTQQQHVYQQPHTPAVQSPGTSFYAPPPTVHNQHPHTINQYSQHQPQQPSTFVPPPPPAQQFTHHGHGPPPGGWIADDEAVLAAQKHAKWAISALNFEDVGTAVKELRAALVRLGAA
ncbi:hypothetical protein LTR56_001358 [Elasticomyces elasticus]|nr:hypothetical protein LTR56_001358 [Elasticomyces elasticus]KAK3667539.1 hypothetical protein LTR22_001717 [Elasticomyces elasticus]